MHRWLGLGAVFALVLMVAGCKKDTAGVGLQDAQAGDFVVVPPDGGGLGDAQLSVDTKARVWPRVRVFSGLTDKHLTLCYDGQPLASLDGPQGQRVFGFHPLEQLGEATFWVELYGDGSCQGGDETSKVEIVLAEGGVHTLLATKTAPLTPLRFDDDLTAPPSGTARVRFINDQQYPVDLCTADDQLLALIPPASASPYLSLAAVTQTLRWLDSYPNKPCTGDGSDVVVTPVAGMVHSAFVLDGPPKVMMDFCKDGELGLPEAPSTCVETDLL